jgi:type VI secretion system protein ImpF
MAERGVQERLQPALLDRLTDEEPRSSTETRERRTLSLRRLRAAVLRDLSWLLNTSNLAAIEDLEGHPEVARSVLNYGVPDLSGLTASGLDVLDIEREVRQALLDFEPRIIGHSLRVSVLTEDRMDGNALGMQIDGMLWAQPMPVRLLLSASVDLESGDWHLRDHGGG